MKKTYLVGAILLMAGTVLAQSNDTETVSQGQPPVVVEESPSQPPVNPIERAMREARRRQEALQATQGREMPSKQVQADKIASLPATRKLSAVPEESNRNQLIRNLPYQPEKMASAQAASSEPTGSGILRSPRTVVCVVNGYEQKNVSAADCKAQGGHEFETAEVLGPPKTSGRNK